MQIKGDCKAHILRILVPGAKITFLCGQVNSLNWWNRSCSRQRPHFSPCLIASLSSFWIELQSLYFLSLEPLGQVSTGMLCKQQGRLSRHQNCFSQVFSSQAQSLFLQIAWNTVLYLTTLCLWRPKCSRPYADPQVQGNANQSPVRWKSSCIF